MVSSPLRSIGHRPDHLAAVADGRQSPSSQRRPAARPDQVPYSMTVPAPLPGDVDGAERAQRRGGGLAAARPGARPARHPHRRPGRGRSGAPSRGLGARTRSAPTAPARWRCSARQVNSPLLWLLVAAAAVSAFVGEGVDAAIIAIILVASIGSGLRERVSSRAGRRGDALRDPSPGDRHPRRRAPAGRGDPPRARRPGAPRRRFDRARRPPAARGQQPGVRRVDPHRRVRALEQGLRPGRAGIGAGRAVLVPVHGQRRARGLRRRRGGGHRRPHRVRPDRRRAGRTPAPDRVPDRADPVLGPAGQGRGRVERHHLRGQRRCWVDR